MPDSNRSSLKNEHVSLNLGQKRAVGCWLYSGYTTLLVLIGFIRVIDALPMGFDNLFLSFVLYGKTNSYLYL